MATVASTIRQFLIPHAVHMRRLGWRVDSAAAGLPADAVAARAFDAVYDLPLSRSIRAIRALVAGERAVSAVLRSAGVDIVHVHTPIASLITRLAVRRLPPAGRPIVIYTAHGFHFSRTGRRIPNAGYLFVERVAGRWTDWLVVINDEDEAAARRYRLVPPSRIVRHPGIGLDTAHYAAAAVAPEDVAGVRDRLQIPPGVVVFLVIGELNGNKRQADAIAALARASSRDAQLLLVGDGPKFQQLASLAAHLRVADRVRFLGFLDDVRPVILASTALVAPSAREGLSRSVMEALALERLVIASGARGNAELVGEDGFIVEVGDVDGIANAMDRAATALGDGVEMGRRGRQRMVDRYDVGRVSALHEALYAAAIEAREGALSR